MECARICAWGEYEATTLYQCVIQARKEHVYCECGRKINKNERYECYKLIYDGEISRFKTCLDCISLRDAFFDSWSFTNIWNDFHEYIDEANGDEINWSALSKLTDPAQDMAFEYIGMVRGKMNDGEEDE